MTQMKNHCSRWLTGLCYKLGILLCMLLFLWGVSERSVHGSLPKNAIVRQQHGSRSDSSKNNIDGRILNSGKLVEQELSGGVTHFYEITLTANQYLNVIVDQQGIDVVVTIFEPNGKQVAQVDRPSGSRGPESISLISDESGAYHIQVQALEKTAPKAIYTILAKYPRPAAAEDEIRIKAERAVSEGERLRAEATEKSLPEAIKEFKKSLQAWESLNERYEQALALYGIGWSYSELGSQGLVKLPLPLHQIRWTYDSRTKYETAIRYFSKALAIMQELNNDYGEAITRTGLAWAELYLEDNKGALNNFIRALQIHRSYDNRRGEAITLYGLGWLQALMGEDQKALENFQLSLSLRPESDRRGKGLTLSAIGRLYSRLGKNQEAVDYLKQARELFHQTGNKYAEADALSNLGWVYISLSQHNQALEHFQAALPLRREAKDPTGEANTLYGLARIRSFEGDLLGAAAQMNDVLDIIEPLRTKGSSEQLRTSYFASVQDYYRFYIDLLMRLQLQNRENGYSTSAFWINERARARELLDVLSTTRLDMRGEIDQTLMPVKPRSPVEIQRLLDDDTILLEYAFGEERSYLWMVTQASITGYDIGKRVEIEEKAQLVHKLLTARNQNYPGETISQWKTRVAQADSNYARASAILSEVLLRPVATLLGRKRLIIVAQGALQFVPFAALPVPGIKLQPYENTSHLLVDHEIIYLPSASTLKLLRERASYQKLASKTVALFADPVFTEDDPRIHSLALRADIKLQNEEKKSVAQDALREGDNFTGDINSNSSEGRLRRLIGTRWEAEQIAALVTDKERIVALDFAANPKAATSPDLAHYRIIHFATHAFINNATPENSAIILSQFNEQGQPQDGRLKLEDIYRLKLSADMVVLSACNTGLGKEVSGEGLIGLTRGFMYAGAQRVVVSLWALDNIATAELMVRFYKKMLGPDRLSPAAALRAAQLDISKDSRWQSPFFWAGIVLQGEWKKREKS